MYEWVRGGGLEGRRERIVGGLAALSLVPGGLIVYMGYLWLRFGDPLLFYSAQKNWGRQATGPLATAGRAWESAAEGAGSFIDPGLRAHPTLGNLADHLAAANNLYNLAFFVFALVVLLSGLRELPLSLSIYGLLLVAPATLFGTPESPLMGTPRYVLVSFPIFIVLGLLSGRKLLFGGWLLLSTVISLALCGLFVSWRFVA
jgi:hypothetical protein